MIRGRNVLAQGPDESGRIFCIALSAIQLVDVSQNHVQAFILAPNKERAVRIAKAIRVLGGEDSAPRSGMTPKVYACVAATSTATDIFLSPSPQIVVGTPGRIYHLLDRGHLSASSLKVLLCDEADDLCTTFKQLLLQNSKMLPSSPVSVPDIFHGGPFPFWPCAFFDAGTPSGSKLKG